MTNSGPDTSSGTTTVQDILPTGVVLDGTASGSGWSCSATGVTIRCSSTLIVASGASYPDITVPFRVTATAGQSVTNIAAVTNPLEVNPCNADGSMPATDSAVCTRDPLNSDPAVLTIPGGGGGGSTYYIPTCVNGIRSCSAQIHNSLPGCALTTGQTCYTESVACAAANTLVCSGPGGGGGG